jgi:hypothetical protein
MEEELTVSSKPGEIVFTRIFGPTMLAKPFIM